jgi:hypothetical protein
MNKVATKQDNSGAFLTPARMMSVGFGIMAGVAAMLVIRVF